MIKIYLIGKTCFKKQEFARFLNNNKTLWKKSNASSDTEKLIEIAGRICYMSFGNNQSNINNKKFIQKIIKMGHESILEHSYWTFIITGVSRAFSHQFVRHRVGFSISQLSQQYYNQESMNAVIPALIRKSPKAFDIWKRSVDKSQRAYIQISNILKQHFNKNFMNKKEFSRLIKTTARSVLPNATETIIMFTANARALRHFLRIRGAIYGDEEMRYVAAGLLTILHKQAPTIFSDFYIKNAKDKSLIVLNKKDIK